MHLIEHANKKNCSQHCFNIGRPYPFQGIGTGFLVS